MLDFINRRYYDDGTRTRNGVESEETKGSLIMLSRSFLATTNRVVETCRGVLGIRELCQERKRRMRVRTRVPLQFDNTLSQGR